MLEQLISCPQDELLQRLRHLKVQTWERMVAASWQSLLSRCETILASAADPATVVDEELLCEVLRVVHDMVSLHPDLKGPVEKLRDLLQRSELQVLLGAERAFGKRYLRLVTAKNRVLVDPDRTLEEAEIEDGEFLTALVLQPQLAATKGAFALWCHGHSAIVTWGHADYGGDISAVRDQLTGVQQVQATNQAFAAILADVSVVTWGDANFGGDSSAVRDQLKGVKQIQATHQAFAAILEDGSVVTWGHARYGGDCSAVRDQLWGVQQIQATHTAFAAILADGSVVTWGDAYYGGDSSAVRDQLRGVQQIQATVGAFAAILADGSVVTWGDACYGGDSSAVRDQLKGVQQIQATDGAFAAILADGSVVTWGCGGFGGDSSAVRDQLTGVQQLHSTPGAFAAILLDGSVVTWGDRRLGGDSSAVRDQLRFVKQIQATDQAFAAIRDDCNGDSSAVQKKARFALRCLAVCPPSRHLQSGPQASALERRLEMLACGGAPSLLDGGSLRDACTATDYVVDDFRFELPASSTEREGSCDTSDELSVLVTTAEAPEGPEAFETLRQRLEASHSIPSASRSAFLLQLRLWCRSRTLEGRREVVAIALFAICNAVKHIRPFVLQQYMQKRPGLLSELCELFDPQTEVLEVLMVVEDG
eukprot:symbB.v1.2.019138.t1/scaffold1556.1/size111904/6